MESPAIPIDNIEVYKYLFCIETGLRELIIESMESSFGKRWHLSRLPPDIREKYEKARVFEQNIKWTSMVPLHPIYYTDFPDLKKIILKKDNWREVFKYEFQKEEFIESMLSELDLIRNKIAHNRKATPTDVDNVEEVYTKLCRIIGKDRFSSLHTKCTYAPNLKEELGRLFSLAKNLLNCCLQLTPVIDISLWERTRHEWWFDESYLGEPVTKIEAYFSLVEAYAELPRLRGTGHIIETWIKASKIELTFQEAYVEFTALQNK